MQDEGYTPGFMTLTHTMRTVRAVLCSTHDFLCPLRVCVRGNHFHGRGLAREARGSGDPDQDRRSLPTEVLGHPILQALGTHQGMEGQLLPQS